MLQEFCGDFIQRDGQEGAERSNSKECKRKFCYLYDKFLQHFSAGGGVAEPEFARGRLSLQDNHRNGMVLPMAVSFFYPGFGLWRRSNADFTEGIFSIDVNI